MSKEEQINTILYGNGKGSNIQGEAFTVTMEEVVDYVRNKGLKLRYGHSRNSLTDGFKFYEEDRVWYCGFQERGIIFNEKVFTDYDEGLEYIVKVLVKLSGVDISRFK